MITYHPSCKCHSGPGASSKLQKKHQFLHGYDPQEGSSSSLKGLEKLMRELKIDIQYSWKCWYQHTLVKTGTETLLTSEKDIVYTRKQLSQC